MRRRWADDGSERGFTLVEVIASVVIMGLVIGPLCMALNQAMNLIPQDGARTQLATDVDRIQKVFGDDIAQSQYLMNVPAGAVVGFDTSPSTWTKVSTGPSPMNCAVNSSFGTWLVWDQWSDLAVSGAPRRWAIWTAVITGTAPVLKVSLQRYYDPDSSVTGGETTETYASGYCRSGETVATVTSTAPSATQATEDVQLTVNLRDASGLRQSFTLDASVRAMGG